MGPLQRPLLIIRADGGPTLGWGHVLRCLALAQGWESRGGATLFILASQQAEPATRLQQAGHQVVQVNGSPGSLQDAQEVAEIIRRRRAAWLVLDGYHFNPEYRKILKETGVTLLVIDDLGGCSYYDCDFILNQNLFATEALYRQRSVATRLLLGPEYVLLRREFWPWRFWFRHHPRVATRLLITLGGGDQTRVLEQLVAVWPDWLTDIEVTVAVGGAFRGTGATGGMGMTLPHSWRVVSVNEEMPALMAAADLALAGAGTTCWELAFMEVPSLLLVLAENQRHNAEFLEARGAAINLGCPSALDGRRLWELVQKLRRDQTWRQELLRRGGRRLVDGLGVERVVKCLWSHRN